MPPEPGDRTSSLPGPGYDSEEEGGLCNKRRSSVNSQTQSYTRKQQIRAKHKEMLNINFDNSHMETP